MRHGFSLLEILIFVVILGLALLPVFGLGQATHRRADFDERQQIASARAKTMLDLAASLDFNLLAAIANGKSGPVAVPLDSLVGAAAMQSLFAPFAGTDAGADTQRLTGVSATVTFVGLGSDLGQLVSEATWANPAHPDKPHSVRLTRIVSRREGVFTHEIKL